MTNKTTTTTKTTQAGMTPMERIAAQAAETARMTPGTRQAKTPKPCCGGCGLMTRGGNWFPGHDGRVHGRMARIIRLGATPAEAMVVVTCGEEWDEAEALDAILRSQAVDAAEEGGE